MIAAGATAARRADDDGLSAHGQIRCKIGEPSLLKGRASAPTPKDIDLNQAFGVDTDTADMEGVMSNPDRTMDIYLRLLAEKADEALTDEELAARFRDRCRNIDSRILRAHGLKRAGTAQP